MANGRINFGKQSGGVLGLLFPDGVTNTEVTLPESGILAKTSDINTAGVGLKTIATGTATFTATTNNINLTGIGVGVEIGDVIQISGAEDAKNNSEFTIEVITDANNIIVNQAHAGKGTTKNLATRSSDSEVTVKLLSKWYNAPIGLGQDFVSLTGSRAIGVTYPNNTKRALFCIYGLSSDSYGTLGESNVSGFSIPNIGQVSAAGDSFSYLVVPNSGTYARSGGASINVWLELR